MDADVTRLPVQAETCDVDKDVTEAVFKAFNMMEEMGGSQKNLLDMICFERDLYCKYAPELADQWPKTWTECMHILMRAGYKDPKTYYICLDESHPYVWSTLDNSRDICHYCDKPGTIEFHCLSLYEKVQRWCSVP